MGCQTARAVRRSITAAAKPCVLVTSPDAGGEGAVELGKQVSIASAGMAAFEPQAVSVSAKEWTESGHLTGSCAKEI